MDIFKDGSFLFGTIGGEIFEKKSWEYNFKSLIHSHYEGEILCCITSPENY